MKLIEWGMRTTDADRKVGCGQAVGGVRTGDADRDVGCGQGMRTGEGGCGQEAGGMRTGEHDIFRTCQKHQT